MRIFLSLLLALSFSPPLTVYSLETTSYDGTLYSETGFVKMIREGNYKVVKLFIESGINVNVKTHKNLTPLMWATLSNHPHLVKLLLIHGAQINQQDVDGYTALMWASRYGRTDIVRTLLKTGANPEMKDYRMGWNALMLAARYGHKDTVLALIHHGINVNAQDKYGWNALTIAQYERWGEIERMLRQEGTLDYLCRPLIPQNDPRIRCTTDPLEG